MNSIFAGLPVSIFEEMSGLARQHQAINLGQGFPDDPGPEDVRRKAAEAVVSGISTLRSIGLAEIFLGKWMTNWAWSWSVAFPAVIVVLPVVRAIVARIVAPPPRS